MSSFNTSLCNPSQLTSELDSSLVVMLMRSKDLFLVVHVLIWTLFSETVMDSPRILLNSCTCCIKVMHVYEPGLKYHPFDMN